MKSTYFFILIYFAAFAESIAAVIANDSICGKSIPQQVCDKVRECGQYNVAKLIGSKLWIGFIHEYRQRNKDRSVKKLIILVGDNEKDECIIKAIFTQYCDDEYYERVGGKEKGIDCKNLKQILNTMPAGSIALAESTISAGWGPNYASDSLVIDRSIIQCMEYMFDFKSVADIPDCGGFISRGVSVFSTKDGSFLGWKFWGMNVSRSQDQIKKCVKKKKRAMRKYERSKRGKWK